MSAHRGEINAVILDWAGTTIDFGSRAPTEVVIEVFRRIGIEITTAEARGPMGMAKREHLALIAALPRVAACWRKLHGREVREADVQAIYEDFIPLQKEILAARGSEVIPGVAEAIAELRRRGLKIGSTTGYTRELMEVVAPIAARGGYAPDVLVCSDDVRCGRPAPWMNFRAAEQLGVYPMHCVVLDDTPVGIAAGLNAGARTIAVSQTGNGLGLSPQEVSGLPAGELLARLHDIEREFYALGADLVVRSVAELPEAMARLERDRLATPAT